MTSVVAPGVGSMRRLSRRGFSDGTIGAMIPRNPWSVVRGP